MSVDLTTFFLVLFALTGLCFLATGCQNPGVPPQPKRQPDASYLPHPGEAYSLSRDTNRYVHGFDHFCEFVGNDIGMGNLGGFVTFLVLLSVLCTYVVVLSGWQVYLMLMPPGAEAAGGVAPGMPGLPPQSDLQPHWHLLLAPWRLLIAATVIGTLAYAIVKCTGSEVCAGVMPLIMMMPGATFGAVLIVLVFGLTVAAADHRHVDGRYSRAQPDGLLPHPAGPLLRRALLGNVGPLGHSALLRTNAEAVAARARLPTEQEAVRWGGRRRRQCDNRYGLMFASSRCARRPAKHLGAALSLVICYQSLRPQQHSAVRSVLFRF